MTRVASPDAKSAPDRKTLFLSFQLGSDSYVIAVKSVVEVVPMVTLSRFSSAAPHVAGQFNYRGHIIPAIDLPQLVNGTPFRASLGTRLIIVEYPSPRGTTRFLALIAERATETLSRRLDDFQDTDLRMNAAEFLGGVAATPQGIVRLFRVEKLLNTILLDLTQLGGLTEEPTQTESRLEIAGIEGGSLGRQHQ
jgi:chemotaxis-related protein WspB